jgi:hypothetical protein
MYKTVRQLKVAVGPILFQLQLRINEIRNQYKLLEGKQDIPIASLKKLQSNINDLKHFIKFHKVQAKWDELVFSDDYFDDESEHTGGL